MCNEIVGLPESLVGLREVETDKDHRAHHYYVQKPEDSGRTSSEPFEGNISEYYLLNALLIFDYTGAFNLSSFESTKLLAGNIKYLSEKGNESFICQSRERKV